MKTLNCLIFAAVTFTTTVQADPLSELSANVGTQLNSQFEQMSLELTNQLHSAVDQKLEQMLKELQSKAETDELTEVSSEQMHANLVKTTTSGAL